jgi:hypothetical protein
MPGPPFERIYEHVLIKEMVEANRVTTVHQRLREKHGPNMRQASSCPSYKATFASSSEHGKGYGTVERVRGGSQGLTSGRCAA